MSTSLVYTKSAFVPFTKIVSADMNQYFTDLKARINWAGGVDAATGLGDDNVQSNAATGGGLTRSTKLKKGTASYVLVNDGTGAMSESATLSTALGGAGGSLAGGNSGDVPTFNGSIFTPLPPVPTGVVFPYVGLTAPTGYLLANGQAVSRATYSVLFAIIASTYGQGDGSTTFNVPDMRGMFERGASMWSTQTFTANNATSTFTTTAGAITRSGQPVQVSTSSALPSGLSVSTTYYTIYATSTTFKLATTEANALAGTNLTITTNGTGTQTITNYADPEYASRTGASSGGATGVNPGSVQPSALQKHTHQFDADTSWTTAGTGHVARVGDGSADQPIITDAASTTVVTSATSNGLNTPSGGETRPRNMAYNYIIKT